MAVPRVFYPYPTVRMGWIDLDVEVEGEPEGIEQLTHGSVVAAAVEAPFALKVTFRFDISKVLRDLSLRESESDHVRLVILESGVWTRTRRQLGSFPVGVGDQVVMRLEFDPAAYRGDVEVQAVLVYTPEANHEPASRCGESERLLIHFDEFQAPAGAGMEIRWVDFSQEVKYRDVAAELFSLDLIKEPPLLLLNEGLESFKRTLMSKGNRGAAARIRESQFTLIGSQVWHAMLSEALGRLMEALEDDEGEDFTGAVSGWRERVLTGWAPSLLQDRDAGIKELAAVVRDNPDKLLLEDLPRQIQLRVAAGRSFSGLSREFLDPGAFNEVTADE